MDTTPESRAKKRYAYHTNPEINIAVDLKAQELAKGLPSLEIGSELAMYGCTVLVEREGETVIMDPDSYSLNFKSVEEETDALSKV